jgi:hypothetical protein
MSDRHDSSSRATGITIDTCGSKPLERDDATPLDRASRCGGTSTKSMMKLVPVIAGANLMA